MPPRRRMWRPEYGLLALAMLAAGCASPGDTGAVDELLPPGDEPTLEEPASPALRRLTVDQYHNSLTDLFGEGLVLPTSLEPDTESEGLISIGAAVTTISPRGVEQYEDAAYSVAEQVLASPELRAALVPCEPTGLIDSACTSKVLVPLATRAWRRPLEAGEPDTLAELAAHAAGTLGDFDQGLVYGIAAILQSPHFLFRQELGVADDADPSVRLYDDFELASRLSYLLWNSTPDDVLLTAAYDGELSTPDGLLRHAERLLDDERARVGLRAFFSEMLRLHALDDLSKDPLIFVHMSSQVGPSAREETLLGLERIVFDEDGDWRDFLTTRTTWMDTTLAAIYNVQAPAREGFGETELPEEGGRRGFLGQVSFLALNAHAVSSSATLRGKFVRERLLCESVPPPPSDVDTSIPEPSEDAATLRERVAEHLENDYCASCHLLMDPIGLGFENFDGLGLWRTHDNGALIDPSGDLDGATYGDSWDFAELLHDDPRLGACLANTLFRYASGHGVTRGDYDSVIWLGETFAWQEHSVRSLMLTLVTSESFRRVGEVE